MISDKRYRKQPSNLLLDVMNESVPFVHLSKLERVDIFKSFKDLYHEYWENQQRYLVMVPAMDAAESTLTILSYTQHLANIATAAQKTSDENAWSLVQLQTKLKARV